MQASGIAAVRECAAQQGIPLDGMFELTGHCNLRCGFCYVCDRAADSPVKQEKTAEEWLDMIRQAADAGMLVCTFTGGEPFMREDFEEIYCKAYDMGLRTVLFTNATLIGERQRAFLRKRPPSLISISLYGASENSYRKICGNGEDYPRVMASINALHAAGFHMEIKTPALRPLLNEFEAIGRVSKKYHCLGKLDVFVVSRRDGSNRNVSRWRIPLDQLSLALRSFQRGTGAPNPADSPKILEHAALRENLPAFLCLAGRSTFFIAHDGRMMGCPTLTGFETYPFVSGFGEAWSALKEMIDHAPACDECNHCPHLAACPSCPVNRIGETGSITKCNAYMKELAYTLSLHVKEDAG